MTYDEISSKLHVSMSTIRDLLLKFKTKFEYYVPESLQFYNVWNFAKRDTHYGLEGAAGHTARAVQTIVAKANNARILDFLIFIFHSFLL